MWPLIAWLPRSPIHGWAAIAALAVLPALVAGAVLARWWAVFLALGVLLAPIFGERCTLWVGSDYRGNICITALSLGQAAIGLVIESVVIAVGVGVGRWVRGRLPRRGATNASAATVSTS